MANQSTGAGVIDDAVDPLVAALKAGSQSPGAESPGDRRVIAAVKLGWLMREVAGGAPPSPSPAGLTTVAERHQAQGLQLAALLGALPLTLPGPAVDLVVDQLQTGSAATHPAQTLHPKLVTALFGVDGRLPAAYALGGDLRALIPALGEPPALPGPALITALDALSSELPSHAARGVAESMDQWSRSDDPSKATLIEAQADLWRSVIVGEKRGTELLEPVDYIDAAKQLEQKLLRRALRSVWLLAVVGVALILFTAGVVAIFALHGTADKIAAGATGVLTAVGLTWKGIGGTLGKLLGKLEAPLWGAELDTAIADAITLTNRKAAKPTSLPGTLAYADRRGRALTAPRG